MVVYLSSFKNCLIMEICRNTSFSLKHVEVIIQCKVVGLEIFISIKSWLALSELVML